MSCLRARRSRGTAAIAACLALPTASAFASNEVAALCLFPILGIGTLVAIASALFWALLPLCLACGLLLGRWSRRRARPPVPDSAVLVLLGLGLVYAIVMAFHGFGVPDDPNAAIKVGRCTTFAGSVHPAEKVLWLPVAALIGLIAGVMAEASKAREAQRGHVLAGAAAEALARGTGEPRLPPAPLAGLSLHPPTQDTAAPTPAPGLRPLSRIPVQTVDADTRARIAAAAARKAGKAPPAAKPPPLPPAAPVAEE